MLQEQRIWLLISLKLSGEASIEELKELEAFLTSNPDLVRKLEMLESFWQKPSSSSNEQAKKSFEKHLQRLSPEVPTSGTNSELQIVEPISLIEKPKRSYKRFLWVAAAACVLAVWFGVRNYSGVSSRVESNTVSTQPGFKASVNLPDGSKVWLNTNSKITYDGSFNGEVREVYLSGEAYFDVAKDKNRPFIIHTKTINLKVLGTAFNVRSYDTDKETETSLVHGSVEITLKNNPDKKIVLKPGEKLLVKNTQEDSVLKQPVAESVDEEQPIAVLAYMHYYGNDSSAVETSWTKNQLVFNNERLDKIILGLERWFGVEMTIKDESLKAGRYKITIEEGDKLEDILEALKFGGRLNYSIKNNEVIINR